MRAIKRLPFFLFACFLCATACAQQVGDKIVAVVDTSLSYKDGRKETAWRGNCFFVEKIEKDRFWVICDGGDSGTVEGWVKRSDVMLFAKALDFFDEQVKRNPTFSAYAVRGWLLTESGKYDRAIADYNEAIRLDPNNKWLHNNRGMTWRAMEQYDKAIADFEDAILADPAFAAAYNNRGTAWNGKRRYIKAIADFGDALRFDPKDSRPYLGRGDAWYAQGQYAMAIDDYQEKIRLDPKNNAVYGNLAWLLSTCTDAKYRDGKKAVEMATKQCQLTGWKDPNAFDKLAAAYAESGDFSNAVKWQKKAVEEVPAKSKSACQARLELYKSAKPYREKVPK